MTTTDHLILLSHFGTSKQHSIVEDIFSKYNTSHDGGIKAALSDAAWQGYCQCLDDLEKYNERTN